MECEDKHILYWDQTRTSRWVCCTHSWEPWALAANSRGFKVLTEFNSYLMIMCCMRCVMGPRCEKTLETQIHISVDNEGLGQELSWLPGSTISLCVILVKLSMLFSLQCLGFKRV